MKKNWILLVLLLAFLPLVVKAEEDIVIESISLNSKSGTVTEINEATVSGKNITLDLNMSEVGDYAEYTIMIKNSSNQDQEINTKNININSDYIEYSLKTKEDSNIIKANSSIEATLKVLYKTEVPEESFESGQFSDNNIMKLSLCGDCDKEDTSDTIENPDTGDKTLTGIYTLIALFLISGMMYYMIRKKKFNKITLFIVGVILTTPIIIHALCNLEINVDAKVTISKKNLSAFKFSCTGDDEYHFSEGMTFGEWIKSDFYPGNIGGEYSSVEKCKEIWGENKGCAEETYENVYSYLTASQEEYTDSREECEEYNNCEEVNNQYYLLTYTYHLYDTLEACEETYGNGDCGSINNKYGYIYKTIFPTEEECNEELSYNTDNYPSCTLLPKAYKYTSYHYSDFYTLEECEKYHQETIELYAGEDTWVDSGNCIMREIKHKNSPQYKQGTMKGHFDFWEEGAMYVNDEFLYFEYDKVLSNQTYECVRGGECVSPESDILSSNGKTIKAKNIKENDDIAYYNFDTNQIEFGKVHKIYIHKDANSFVKYIFEDNTTLDVTDYHPIYTKDGWKSYTNRNGYATPIIGDLVKTNDGYKKLTKIEPSHGKEDYYDFQVMTADGNIVNNYFANGVLVEGSY